MSPILRRQTWSQMTATERDALCQRGLAEIFNSDLRESIGSLIEDVRVRRLIEVVGRQHFGRDRNRFFGKKHGAKK